MPQNRCHLRSLLKLLSLLVAIAAVVLASAVPASAADKYGLGGGSTLPQKAALGVFGGQNIPHLGDMLVENTGTATAEVEFTTSGPDGLTITASRPKLTLKPGEGVTVQLAASVGAQTVPGEYAVIGQFSQTNVPPGPGGTIVYAPAVNTTVNFSVKGATSNVTVKAVSENDGSPVAGNLTLAYVSTAGQTIPVATLAGTELTAKVAPGPYRATFEIPGLVSQSTDFTLADNETKTVEIKLKAVSFLLVGVKPVRAGDSVTSANLVASIKNDISPIPGPVSAVVNVKADGEPLETAELSKFQTLPSGLSDVKLNYVPAEGFKEGSTYSFEFQIITPKFTVTGPEVPSFEVPWWTLVKKAIAGVIILLIAGAVFYALRRSRRKLANPI